MLLPPPPLRAHATLHVTTNHHISPPPRRHLENKTARARRPWYANTHTDANITALQTSRFYHEARDIIRNATNASEQDAVIFAGSGVTGAVHKLVHALDVEHTSTVVLVGHMEHHSNICPWRDNGATVVSCLARPGPPHARAARQPALHRHCTLCTSHTRHRR